MAGAEGIEPSARGFGGDVGKRPGCGAVRPFQAVTGFKQVTLRRGDAILMLYARFRQQTGAISHHMFQADALYLTKVLE